MLAAIRAGLAAAYDPKVVDELLAAYAEAKQRFYEGGLRLAEVEGGRFCEAAYRLLEQRAFGKFTPLGKQLDTEDLTKKLLNLAGTAQPDAVRLHIPRALRMVYDIRNKRDAAHLGDGIDPNLQDASVVIGCLDWVMAEFVRLHHSVSANEAQAIVEALVTRRSPVVKDFDGFLKVLNPSLKAADHFLLLLYERGAKGAALKDLESWARPAMRANIRRTLYRLEHDQAWIHQKAGGVFVITPTGLAEVERRRLHAVS